MKPPFKLKVPYRPWHADRIEPFVMKLADELSNDPMIAGMLGPNFKVIVDYNAETKRITYSFRTTDDILPGDSDAKSV